VEEAAQDGPAQADVRERVLAQRRGALRPAQEAREPAPPEALPAREHSLRSLLARRGCRRLPLVRAARRPAEELLERLQERRWLIHGNALCKVQVVDGVAEPPEVLREPAAELPP